MSLTDKDIEVEEAIIKAEGDGTALSASAGSSMGDVKKFLSLVREENPLLGGELDQATSLRFRWVLDGSPVPRPLVLEMGFRSELFFHRFFCGWWGKSSSVSPWKSALLWTRPPSRAH